MRTIYIRRKKKFASALMPYWIITGMSEEEFISQFGSAVTTEDLKRYGLYYPGLTDPASFQIDLSALDKVGRRISNGQTIKIELDDADETIFAFSKNGTFSNEIKIGSCIADENDPMILSTKGGWKQLPYPVFECAEN